MNASPPAGRPPPAPAPRSLFHRRVRAPLLALLTRGATPEKLASGVGWGVVCSLFPILGCTTALNAAVAAWRGLNHPLLQAINVALGGAQLLMILVYVRLGETLLGAEADRFSVADLLRAFEELGLGDFLRRFALAGLHAFVAWALTAPVLYLTFYYGSLPALRRLARLLPAVPARP